MYRLYAAALIVAILTACGGDTPPTTEPAAAAPAVAPAGAAPSADTPSTAAQTDAPVIGAPCADPATHLFSCTTKAKKSIIICGQASPERWLQYQYGPLEKPELTYPKARAGSTEAFTSEARTFVSAQGNVVSFTNEGVTYEITEMAGAGGPDGDLNNFAGVVVLERGEQIATVACAGAVKSDWYLLDSVVHPQSP